MPLVSLYVPLDLSLNLDIQILAVDRSAFAQLKLVHQLCPFLERSDLAMVTHALVTCPVDCCNTLYVGLPLESVRKLQWVQNATATLLSGAGYREQITPLLQQLRRLSICFRAQFKVL